MITAQAVITDAIASLKTGRLTIEAIDQPIIATTKIENPKITRKVCKLLI